jgi:hypothetical protein
MNAFYRLLSGKGYININFFPEFLLINLLKINSDKKAKPVIEFRREIP